MHAFFCEASRALMKLGMAIAASRPMIATTIMISTNVNALRREVLSCICYYLSDCGVNRMHGRFIHYFGCPLIARARPRMGLSTRGAKLPPRRMEAGRAHLAKLGQRLVSHSSTVLSSVSTFVRFLSR